MKNICINNEISILLVGIGGYGRNYVNALLPGEGLSGADDYEATLHNEQRLKCGPIKVVGAIDPAPSARGVAEARGIPLFDSLKDFYAEHQADLAILSTPIHLHCEQIKTCLANGSHVLCEKPLCATVDEAEEIRGAIADAGGRLHVWVGYQLSFSRSVRALKDDILSGAFGKPIMLKTIVHYPRNEAYYARNNWAGRKRTAGAAGRLVLDSPIHNAVSHHLNNMLFLLGDAPDRAAKPVSVQAELYRGNPDVENFDTAALRCITECGAPERSAPDRMTPGRRVPVYFYTSHSLAHDGNIGPISQYRFECATIVHTDEREHESFFAFFDDGSTRRYSLPYYDQMQKLWDCIGAIRGGPIPPSGVEAAAQEVICTNGAQLSHPITTIPSEYVDRIGEPGQRFTEVAGLEEMLFECFDRALLPSELNESRRPPWATPGKIVAQQDIINIKSKIL